MSKNIVEHVSHIFFILSGSSPSKAGLMRLHRDDDEVNQIQLFHDASIVDKGKVLSEVRYAVLETAGEKYFCLVNAASRLSEVSLSDIRDEGFTEVNLGAGLFILLVKGLDLALRKGVDEQYLEEFILCQHEAPDYDGHDLDDVVKCFEEVIIFKIASDSSFTDAHNFNVACFLYSYIEDAVPPEIHGFVQYYRDIFKRNTRIFSDNVLLSMTASHWKHCFLEVYRCLEGIFPLPRARNLQQLLLSNLSQGLGTSINSGTTGMSLRDFAGSCYDLLGWKSNERDAIRLLFSISGNLAIARSNLLSVSFISNAAYSIPLNSDQLNDVGEKIYKLRNQLVHQFQPGDEVQIQSDDWPKLVVFLLIFWECCLDEFSSAFQ